MIAFLPTSYTSWRQAMWQAVRSSHTMQGWQAFQAVRNALLPLSSNGVKSLVPWTTFTDPELAQAGLIELQARQMYGDKTQITRLPMSRADRAMTDGKIEEIYTVCQAAHKGGQPFFRVHIFPFRMTAERMEKATTNPNLPFWQNLKTGYDLFEKDRIPPNATVKDKEYAFPLPTSPTDH